MMSGRHKASQRRFYTPALPREALDTAAHRSSTAEGGSERHCPAPAAELLPGGVEICVEHLQDGHAGHAAVTNCGLRDFRCQRCVGTLGGGWHCGAAGIPVVSLSMQLSANLPGKAVGDGPRAWATELQFLASGYGLAHIWLLQPCGKQTVALKLSACLSGHPAFQINKALKKENIGDMHATPEFPGVRP